MSLLATATPFGPNQAVKLNTPFAAQGVLDAMAEVDGAAEADAQGAEIDEAAGELAGGAEESPIEADDSAAQPDPLINEAEHCYGLSSEQAEKLGDQLPHVLAAMDRQAASLMRQQLAATKEPQAPEVAEHPAAPEPKKATQPPVAFEEFKLDLDPNEYDEGTLKNFNSLAGEINAGRKAMAQQQEMLAAMAQLLVATHGDVTQMTEQSQSQSSAEFTSAMDSVFGGLPDEFVATYGKAPIAQLAGNSELVANRNKLIEEMHILEQADAHCKRPKQTPQEYARRALRSMHADKVHVAAVKDVRKQMADHRRKAIATPSGRVAKTGTPEQRALAVVRAGFQAMGLGSN